MKVLRNGVHCEAWQWDGRRLPDAAGKWFRTKVCRAAFCCKANEGRHAHVHSMVGLYWLGQNDWMLRRLDCAQSLPLMLNPAQFAAECEPTSVNRVEEVLRQTPEQEGRGVGSRRAVRPFVDVNTQVMA